MIALLYGGVGRHYRIGYLEALLVDEEGTFDLLMLPDIVFQLGVVVVPLHAYKAVHKVVDDALAAFYPHIGDGGVVLQGDVEPVSGLLHLHPCFVGKQVVEAVWALEIEALEVVHTKHHAGDDLLGALHAAGNGHCTYLAGYIRHRAEHLLMILVLIYVLGDAAVYLDYIGVYEHDAVDVVIFPRYVVKGDVKALGAVHIRKHHQCVGIFDTLYIKLQHYILGGYPQP